jgi:L-aminopeptidase/D-esterase-like protein
LTKAQAKHLAVMAQDGLARAIYPVHTPLDGDTVFAAATGRIATEDPIADMIALGTTAANVLARACARAVFDAQALPCAPAIMTWQARFG